MAIPTAPVREIRFSNVPKVLNMLYSPGVVPNYMEREVLLVTRNARKAKIEHKLSQRTNDQLYWSFITETSRGLLPLSSMRSHFKRKWKNAFAQALKRNGLDFNGRRIPQSPEQPKEVGLRGTLEVRLFNAACWDDKDQSRMVQHSDNIIKGLMGLQNDGRRGSDMRRVR